MTDEQSMAAALAWWNALPCDEEGTARPRKFHDGVRMARTSAHWGETIKTIYYLTGTGELKVLGSDPAMLIYALVENLELVDSVRGDVEKMLNRVTTSKQSGIWSSWGYVLQLSAAGEGASTYKRPA